MPFIDLDPDVLLDLPYWRTDELLAVASLLLAAAAFGLIWRLWRSR